MAIQYKRRIIVDIAGIKIEEPRISFEVITKRDSQEETGSVKIYNLKSATYDHIEKSGQGTPITIDAGYAGVGNPNRIFEGVAQRIWKMREDHAFVTMVTLGDVIRSKESRGGAIEKSFAGETPIREIIPVLVEAMGPKVELGSMDVIPAGATATDFIASGTPGKSLDTLLELIQDRRIRWYTDSNVIRFAQGSKPQADVSVRITKSPKTGLVGVPELQEDDNVKVEMLLDPRVRIGGELVIEGSNYIDNSPRTIMGVVHQGDNWKDRFVTLADAVIPTKEEDEEQN